MASGCADMGEPGPGCGVWDLAAVPQPAEPGGARAVLWLTGRAGGGSSASDDGPLSDLGVSGCVFTGKVKSLLEIQPAGKLPLGRGSAPGEHACRRRAAIATIRMTSLRAPRAPGSWPPAFCLTGRACVCSPGTRALFSFPGMSLSGLLIAEGLRGAASRPALGRARVGGHGSAVLKRLVLLPREAPGCARRGFGGGF